MDNRNCSIIWHVSVSAPGTTLAFAAALRVHCEQTAVCISLESISIIYILRCAKKKYYMVREINEPAFSSARRFVEMPSKTSQCINAMKKRTTHVNEFRFYFIFSFFCCPSPHLPVVYDQWTALGLPIVWQNQPNKWSICQQRQHTNRFTFLPSPRPHWIRLTFGRRVIE